MKNTNSNFARFAYALVLAVGCLSASTSRGTTVLSDNLGQTSNGIEDVSVDRWVTSSFGTDGSSYVLDSVTLRLRGEGTVELDLYSDNAGKPGSFLGALTSPGIIPAGDSDVTFGGNGLGLSANTTYWEVLKGVTGTPAWYWTESTSGTGVGFQHTWGFSEDAGVTWSTFTTQPQLMQVVAATPSTAPDSASTVLLLSWCLVLLGGVRFRSILGRQGSMSGSRG
jgi:hypothetical protein